jgi:ATP-dependent RNA helicase RhlB
MNLEFDRLDLDPRLQSGIADHGYTEMTHVQALTLAETLEGRDVAVQSQTGTGKTAAFLITMYERMSRRDTNKNRAALIIVPTRELAVQIENEAKLLNRHMDYKIGCFFGGMGYSGQLDLLKNGLNVMIGTPGRLLDLSRRGDLRLKDIGYLVIDEADRLFDMGFLPDIRKILRKTPSRFNRQSMLFSATLNRISQQIAYEYMNDPVIIEVTPENMTVDTISQELYHVKSHIKMNLMLGILKEQAPQNALIFTNMKHVAFKVAKSLNLNGFKSQELTGDLPQRKRLQIVKDFTAGKFPYLVATDVAARGLHIEGLEMVINYDIPQNSEDYVHRIGRTARAGKVGKAVALASEGTEFHLEAIEKYIGMKIPVKTVTDELYAVDMSVGHSLGQRFRTEGRSKDRRPGFRSQSGRKHTGKANPWNRRQSRP